MRYFLFLVVLSAACHTSTVSTERTSLPPPEFLPTTFAVEGFDWDSIPYPTTQQIREYVLPARGAQYAAWSYAALGQTDSTYALWDRHQTGSREIEPRHRDTMRRYAQSVAALDYLLERAEDERLLIVNEGHHVPQHRVFTTQLLRGLYDRGYRNFGLEAFFEPADSLLRAQGYPNVTMGFYTKEPRFGELLREATRLGYRVFGYDAGGTDGPAQREAGQAENIERYLRQYPEGKTLIHCGFDHALEGEMGGAWEYAMAERVKQNTGIDPLTINQTDQTERSRRELEHPYRQLANVNVPTVFLDASYQPLGKRRGATHSDVLVFHPRTDPARVRPQWLTYGTRKVVSLDLSGVPFAPPYLVFAYPETEAIGSAVPYDLRETTARRVDLVLTPGTFRIVVQRANGTAVVSTVTVEK